MIVAIWLTIRIKESRGGRGVKENNQVSDNVATKEVVVPYVVDYPMVSFIVDEPVFSSLDGPMVKKVFSSGNKSDTQEGNVGSLLILQMKDPDVNLIKEDVGNVLVWVKLHGLPMTVFSEDGLSVIATKLGTPLILDSYTSDMCMHSWGRSSYARAMIELQANMELKDTIFVAMPKLVGEGFYMCTIRVEYVWKPPKRSSCKVFGHILDECPKKIISDAMKNLKNPRQDARVGKRSLNVAHGSSSNTPIIDKIDKLERQILDGKLMFVIGDGNSLVATSNVDSDSEVEVVFDEITNSMASTSFKGGSDTGYGTNSLLEQWS
ncbi:kinase-like domain, phloem protein 2-like protein [Tanacetum coccineum]